MKLLKSIFALLGLRVKVAPQTRTCPMCGHRPPAHSEAWRKGPLVHVPRDYNDEWTQRR